MISYKESRQAHTEHLFDIIRAGGTHVDILRRIPYFEFRRLEVRNMYERKKARDARIADELYAQRNQPQPEV